MSALKVPTQGLRSDAFLEFDPGISQCGNITDGVSMRLDVPQLKGWWLISFDNLECMYLAAKKARMAEPETEAAGAGNHGQH